ncbi:hypothetical protein Scep_016343 [Stephania cephalantha]|uniref:Uncharacterized protein n=1 Tax=Stephania cephalantha TaxID=152367 RepID=A0AAP0IN13_9MAGN
MLCSRNAALGSLGYGPGDREKMSTLARRGISYCPLLSSFHQALCTYNCSLFYKLLIIIKNISVSSHEWIVKIDSQEMLESEIFDLLTCRDGILRDDIDHS